MSIGDTLAAARRQAGLTITQVSQRTRIRETIIRGIEHDDFSACGGDFYARGHIRSIARAVGADPEPLIQEYDARTARAAGLRGRRLRAGHADQDDRERRRPNWSAAMALALALIIGFVVYHAVVVACRGAAQGAVAGPRHTPGDGAAVSRSQHRPRPGPAPAPW